MSALLHKWIEASRSCFSRTSGKDEIARWTAIHDSRFSSRKLTEHDRNILKGDAGEGRTYVDLLDHYDRERILHQPRFGDADRARVPDFAVTSAQNPDKFIEIVDAKAWSLTRQRNAQGNPLNYEEFFSYLLERPDPRSVLNMHKMQRVVEKYASSPRLEMDGKVVIYLPEDIIRYAPQVPKQIQSWSGTDVAHGKVVEVRSMGVWNGELWRDVGIRLEI